ncbi:MAG: PstS family phosphate ABC transporter substrate-binding protein [Candidatus Lutacidiplasmatales archaeon]
MREGRIRKIVAIRRARLRRDALAVSPVVATLILILVAVAAAAALYLWLVAWQGNVTNGVGTPGAQTTLYIGGSSSVYPWSQKAVAWFEQNQSDVAISLNQGGSGAGMAAVCSGQVDIGASSSPQTFSALTAQYGCPQTVVQETVAYDAVDAIVPSGNVHGLVSISWDTMQAVYVAGVGGAPVPVQAQTNLQSSSTYAMDGSAITGFAGYAAPAASGFAWDQIPACSIPTVATTCVGTTNEAVNAGGIAAGVTAACGGTYAGPALCYTVAGSPCGFVVCAGGTGAGTAAGQNGATIHAWQRQDSGGTTQSFTARLLGVGTSSAASTASVGFGGCAPTGQLTDCGIAGSHQGFGNPGVISGVSGDKDGLGYASDGLVVASGSGVVAVAFQGIGQASPVFPTVASTIVAGIVAGNGGTYGANTYIGWRPFIYVEEKAPTGEALRYLQYVMQPGTNQDIALASNELSPFQPGLAGHVPVTPIP